MRFAMKVIYDQNVCIHAGECVKTLPAVFKVENGKFVIDKTAADVSEIKDTVSKCPTGALKIVESE